MARRTAPKTTAAPQAGSSLERYRSMRDFQVTREPRGREQKKPAGAAVQKLPFVVQKHAATRLHYDFRLAWRGVLKSWAVTKGPSYFPGDTRLAVQVEDHPLEYGDFEGTIPKGQYGGGTVMVWDAGDWTPLGDVDRGLEEGHLKFELHGDKLKGAWALVRMHGRAGGTDKPNWLLIKEKDQFARDAADTPITDEAPKSAATRRTMDQIAQSNDRVWDSTRKDGADSRNAPPTETAAQRNGAARKTAARSSRAVDFAGARKEAFPGFVAPQLAQPTSSAPKGKDWVHEIKLDGYRIQIHVQSKTQRSASERAVQLLTRKGLDWTSRMPDVARSAAELDVTSAILDGEAVALDERGVSNFAGLQAAFHEGKQRFITYYAFDLLHLDGYNLRDLPLSERKRILSGLLRDIGDDTPVRMSESFDADGDRVFAKACALGAEGIVSKLASAKYTSRRGSAWLKLKCNQEQEFVIGGFTLPSKGDFGVGALLLGYYENGQLRYAGRSGTGFTQSTHRTLRARLDRLTRANSPFAEVPHEVRRGALWVKPELVAQIAFSTWTRDKLVRQAAFKGLRDDKPAKEAVREMPLASSVKMRSAGKPSKATSRPQANVAAKRRQHPMADFAITHPDKVLDAESGMTKGTLAEYYAAVAEHMLPHVANRPLSVVRCPEGTSKACFFQKHVGMGLPSSVSSVSIRNRKNGTKEEFLTLDSVEGLLGLAQMGVLEIHPWGSRNDSLERPDRIVFDLDPDEAINWETLAETARAVRARLKKLGLESYLKSTGGKGLHVVVPVEPEHEWPAIKNFAHEFVLRLESDKPDLYVTKMTKATRKNRIYLDYLRNDRQSTSIAPYSPRARSGAPVAMPLQWKELNGEAAPRFHVTDFAQWRGRLRRDPWRTMATTAQELTTPALNAVSKTPSRTMQSS